MTRTRPLALALEGRTPATVSAALHPPAGGGDPETAVLLAHGAGGDMQAPGLVALAGGLAAAGMAALRVNLPHRERGRPVPPRADRAVPGLRAICGAARDAVGAARWVLGGKSYGGRVASLAVAAGEPAAGLVFYGYPLHPAGEPDRPRVDHWPAIAVPCCFLQGTRDDLCDLALLREHLPALGADPHLEVVDGGDHSLHVRGVDRPDGRPRRPDTVLADLAPGVAAWIRGRVAP